MEEGGCFCDAGEAVAAATAGTVRLDPKTQPRDLTERMLSNKAGRTILAIDFDKPNFRRSFQFQDMVFKPRWLQA